MDTVTTIQTVINWLLADPSHIVLASSIICALVPTPNPNTVYGKLYKIFEVLALNIIHSKETGLDKVITQVEQIPQVNTQLNTPVGKLVKSLVDLLLALESSHIVKQNNNFPAPVKVDVNIEQI